MPIVAADILFRLSVTTGPGNSTAQGNPNNSLGDFLSTTNIVDATDNNLFDDISGDENAASDVEYRGFFVYNNHGSLTWQSVVAWLSSEVAGGANAAIAIDGTGVTANNSASQQMEEVANENTAPSGESFSSPTTKGTGLSIGNIPAGSVQGIWVRRTATNSAAQNADGVTIRCEGDTAA